MPPGQQGRQQQAAQQQAMQAQQQAILQAQQAQLQVRLAQEQAQRAQQARAAQARRGQQAGQVPGRGRRALTRRGRAGPDAWPGPVGLAGGGGSQAQALLTISGTDRELPVPAGGLVLGRLDALGQPLSTDKLISRKHARVRMRADGTVEVTDLGSTNGTFLNGRKVTAPTRMTAGDVLRLGDVELRLLGGGPGASRSGETRIAASDNQLLAQARELYGQRSYDEAKLAFRQLATGQDEPAEGRFGLGMVALSQGANDEAEEEFERAVEIDPGHANALYELGYLSENDGQIDAAVAYFGRAISAAPHHVSAIAALNRLTGNSAQHAPPPEPAAFTAGYSSPSTPQAPLSLPGENVPSVYQFLAEDPTPISQQTVELMHRVECEARPRFIAYVGRYFTRTLVTTVVLAIVVVAATIVLNVLHDHYSAIPPSTTVNKVSYVLLVCVAALPLLTLIWGYVVVSCIRVRIYRGRLQIEKGVFRKHLNNIDFWRVHNIDLDRRLINRMTGDGTLVFSLTFGVLPENYQRRRRRARPDHVVEVSGLVHGPQLTELHQDLLNLTFLLRGNPIVKGIIQ